MYQLTHNGLNESLSPRRNGNKLRILFTTLRPSTDSQKELLFWIFLFQISKFFKVPLFNVQLSKRTNTINSKLNPLHIRYIFVLLQPSVRMVR